MPTIAFDCLGTCVSVHEWASVCIFLRFVSPRLCARASVVRWMVLACANVCIRALCVRECVRVGGMIFVADRVSSGTGKNKSSNLKKRRKKRCQTIEVKRFFLDFFFQQEVLKAHNQLILK